MNELYNYKLLCKWINSVIPSKYISHINQFVYILDTYVHMFHFWYYNQFDVCLMGWGEGDSPFMYPDHLPHIDIQEKIEFWYLPPATSYSLNI